MLILMQTNISLMSDPPYHYVRWTWATVCSVTELVSVLKDRFTVTLMRHIPGQEQMISLTGRDIPSCQLRPTRCRPI
jgi:hypothetical protein